MEAFIWMFKHKDFKKHYLFLILVTTILFLSADGILFITSLIKPSNAILEIVFLCLILLTYILPILFPLGYFWELTNNIIEREVDIVANQIYDKKIKLVYKIDLPKLNIFKILWRGFASIIANIILITPYAGLIYITITNNDILYKNYLIINLTVLFLILLPALMWNYAKQNSIFAVLNISKAIYLAGNYTFRYLIATLLFVITYSVNILIDVFVIQLLRPNLNELFSIQNIFVLAGLCCYFIISILKNFYLIFVTAYILGTIVSENES